MAQYQSKNALIVQANQLLETYTSQLNNIDNEIDKLIVQREPLLEKMDLLAKKSTNTVKNEKRMHHSGGLNYDVGRKNRGVWIIS